MRTSIPTVIYVWPLSLGVLSIFTFAAHDVGAQTPTARNDADNKQQITPILADSALDSKAQTYIKNLPKKSGLASARATEAADPEDKKQAVKNINGISRLEEIRVVDAIAPEDYVAPKIAPMMVFRAKLDRQRPRTPQEITQAALCFIGLCKIDTSRELSIADRNEARAKNPPSFAAPDPH